MVNGQSTLAFPGQGHNRVSKDEGNGGRGNRKPGDVRKEARTGTGDDEEWMTVEVDDKSREK